MPIITVDTDQPIVPDVPAGDSQVGRRLRDLRKIVNDLEAIEAHLQAQLAQGRADLGTFLTVFGRGGP